MLLQNFVKLELRSYHAGLAKTLTEDGLVGVTATVNAERRQSAVLVLNLTISTNPRGGGGVVTTARENVIAVAISIGWFFNDNFTFFYRGLSSMSNR